MLISAGAPAMTLAQAPAEVAVEQHPLAGGDLQVAVAGIDDLFEDHYTGKKQKVFLAREVFALQRHPSRWIDLVRILQAETPEIHHVLVLLIEKMQQVRCRLGKVAAIQATGQLGYERLLAVNIEAEEIHRLAEAQAFSLLNRQTLEGIAVIQ